MTDTVCFDFSVNSVKYLCTLLQNIHHSFSWFFFGTKYEQLNKTEFMRHGLLSKSRCKPDFLNILYNLQTAP